LITKSGKELNYIVGVVQKSLYVVPTGVVASELDEFTTGSSRRSASIGEAGVSLFRIYKRRAKELVR